MTLDATIFFFQIKPMCKNKSNLFCNQINTMRFYLHAFSSNGSILKYKLEEFCLSFAFTYRKIDDFQGIAWIKVHLCLYMQNWNLWIVNNFLTFINLKRIIFYKLIKGTWSTKSNDKIYAWLLCVSGCKLLQWKFDILRRPKSFLDKA